MREASICSYETQSQFTELSSAEWSAQFSEASFSRGRNIDSLNVNTLRKTFIQIKTTVIIAAIYEISQCSRLYEN